MVGIKKWLFEAYREKDVLINTADRLQNSIVKTFVYNVIVVEYH